jgi:hypothetical protein
VSTAAHMQRTHMQHTLTSGIVRDGLRVDGPWPKEGARESMPRHECVVGDVMHKEVKGSPAVRTQREASRSQSGDV